MKAAPAIPGVRGNNRRQRLAFDWRGRPYVNDHLDPFFNASVDAAIVLATLSPRPTGSGWGPARSAPCATTPARCPTS